MYTAGTSRAPLGLGLKGSLDNAKAVSPMARYAYNSELGEQGRDALAARAFVLSDVVAVMRLAQSH